VKIILIAAIVLVYAGAVFSLSFIPIEVWEFIDNYNFKM